MVYSWINSTVAAFLRTSEAQARDAHSEGWSPSPYRDPAPSPRIIGYATIKFNLLHSPVPIKISIASYRKQRAGVSKFWKNFQKISEDKFMKTWEIENVPDQLDSEVKLAAAVAGMSFEEFIKHTMWQILEEEAAEIDKALMEGSDGREVSRRTA
jgi:plasmid stability protein